MIGRILDATVVVAALGVLAYVLGEPPPRHPLPRGIRDIFDALAGKPLPTPRNAWIWWQRRTRQ